MRLNRSVEEYAVLTVCGGGALTIGPFAAFRFLRGEMLLGAVDAGVATVMALMAIFMWRTRRVRLAGALLCLAGAVGLVTVVHLKGPPLLYWAYPSTTATFFLVRQREGLIINLLIVLAMVPGLLPRMTGPEFLTSQVTLGVTTLFAYMFAGLTASHRAQLSLLVMKDALTGAGNRRAFDEKVVEAIATRRRTGQPVSLLTMDLDHFKRVNDTHGHEAGDRVLCRVCELIRSRIRVTDGLFRIGGEEFVIIALGASLEPACHLAEQLRLRVEASHLTGDIPLTVSFGVAELSEGLTAAECLKRADTALYRAKHAGRNTVRRASLPKPTTSEVAEIKAPTPSGSGPSPP